MRGKLGKGLSGCLRYALGEGNDPQTRQPRPAVTDAAARVAWIGGQGFGWTPTTRDDAELARQVMEFAALNQTSKTRPCVKDCLHLILSWRSGEQPAREEMEQAAREALAAVGMKQARALFVAHRDTDHAHLHIIASRINPVTGRAFSDRNNFTKWQKWARSWEQRHGGIQCPGRKRHVDQVAHRAARHTTQKRAGSPLRGPRAPRATNLSPEARAALWAAGARQATRRSASAAAIMPERTIGPSPRGAGRRDAAKTAGRALCGLRPAGRCMATSHAVQTPRLAFVVAGHAMCEAQRIDYMAACRGQMTWREYFRKWGDKLTL